MEKKEHHSRMVLNVKGDISESMTMKFAKIHGIEKAKGTESEGMAQKAEYDYISFLQDKVVNALPPLNIMDFPLYIIALEVITKSFESYLSQLEGKSPLMGAAVKKHLEDLREVTFLETISREK